MGTSLSTVSCQSTPSSTKVFRRGFLLFAARMHAVALLFAARAARGARIDSDAATAASPPTSSSPGMEMVTSEADRRSAAAISASPHRAPPTPAAPPSTPSPAPPCRRDGARHTLAWYLSPSLYGFLPPGVYHVESDATTLSCFLEGVFIGEEARPCLPDAEGGRRPRGCGRPHCVLSCEGAP